FESRRRIGELLKDLAAAFTPDRPAVLCRELTKTHEEIRRGPLGELAAGVAGETAGDGEPGAPVLGEVTLGVARAPGGAGLGTVAGGGEEAAGRERAGASRRDAVAAVAAERGLRRREVYNAVVHPEPPAPR